MQRAVHWIAAAALVASACASDGGELTVYSGRSEDLVGPLIADFEEATGIEVTVRYAGSTELAATLLEEGDRTPADVFFAQDPASLGAVADLFAPLPADVVGAAREGFSDSERRWVGVSGRVRVIVTGDGVDGVDTVDDLTAPEWRGRLGIAPSNGSFLAFVAAMLLTDGEEATRAWLEAIAANDPQKYANNSSIVDAVIRGEVDAGLVNHYYLLRAIAEQGDVPAANHFLTPGDPGALVMPAGAGILASSDDPEAAARFIEYLLSADAQRYFAEETFEYPLRDGVSPAPGLPALAEIAGPGIDLSGLATTLDRATELVADAGLL